MFDFDRKKKYELIVVVLQNNNQTYDVMNFAVLFYGHHYQQLHEQ
jgi:hypothetical protein